MNRRRRHAEGFRSRADPSWREEVPSDQRPSICFFLISLAVLFAASWKVPFFTL